MICDTDFLQLLAIVVFRALVLRRYSPCLCYGLSCNRLGQCRVDCLRVW